MSKRPCQTCARARQKAKKVVDRVVVAPAKKARHALTELVNRKRRG